MFTFEGVVGYSASEPEDAAHFFEHTLGLQAQAEEAGLRFYSIGEGLTVTVDTSGASAGDPPYLLFSTDDLVEAAEHFLNRGCAMKPLAWAPEGGGFVARSPEGYSVAVVDRSLLSEGDDDGTGTPGSDDS